MKTAAFLLGFGLCATVLPALDWGGTFGNAASYSSVTTPDQASSFSLSSSLKFWGGGTLFAGSSFLAQANLANVFTQGLGAGNPRTNTVTASLDYAFFSNEFLKAGRTDFHDFGSTVLNTKLDGVQLSFSLPYFDLKAFTGTPAFLFKSGSTVIMSEDDTKDRQITEDWRKPSTLWAAPRLVGGFEGTLKQWIPDQNFHLSLIGQYDLRSGEAKDGDRANTEVAARSGAPLSTAYLGTGWDGRIAGPLYAGVWAFGMAGTSLTAVGSPVTVTPAGKAKTTTQYQTWKASTLLGGLGSADLTLLMPSLSYLVVDLGTQLGSWDPDGATPDQNAAETPSSMTPTRYTGWVGISRTASAVIFNPQPTNMSITQLLVSVKPNEAVQIASSSFLFVRPSSGPITETGVKPTTSEKYLGAEADVSILLRPASDLGGTIAFGLFAPNSAAMTRGVEAKVQATVNLSF